MKNKIIIITIAASSMMLANCSPSSEKQVAKVENAIERDIKKEKEETIKDLQSLRDDINSKLDNISKKLEDANSTSQNELESVKVILVDHRGRVETALDEIDKSADDTWDNIHQGAKNTFNEVKLDCEKISERLDIALKNANK